MSYFNENSIILYVSCRLASWFCDIELCVDEFILLAVYGWLYNWLYTPYYILLAIYCWLYIAGCILLTVGCILLDLYR